MTKRLASREGHMAALSTSVVIKLQASDCKGANRTANLRRIMAYLRATALILASLLFLCLAPLQWVALRRRWPLRLLLPVAFSRTLAALLRLDVVTESAKLPEGPRLIVANHLSWLDIVAVCCIEPVCFLAKREIGSWPVCSTFARLQETVFVDRQRRRSIPGANAAMAQRMLAGRPCCFSQKPRPVTARHSANFIARIWPPRAISLPRLTGSTQSGCKPVAIRYSTPTAAWFGDATLTSASLGRSQGRADPLRSRVWQAARLCAGRQSQGDHRSRRIRRRRHARVHDANDRAGPRRAGRDAAFDPLAANS